MHLFANLTREQLRTLAPNSLCVLPLGATEQHGPHLATGADFYIIESLAREAATRASPRTPVILAPTLPFGSSDHHLPFGGTLSLPTETYYRVLTGLLRSLVRDGFRRVFLLNGHGGNHELAQLAARDIALEHPVRVAAASYWTVAWDALVALGAHERGRLPGHAGHFETSLMLALGHSPTPPLPHRDGNFHSDPRSFHPPWREESHSAWSAIDGYTDSPHTASAEWGVQCHEAIVEALAQAFVAFSSDASGS